MHRNDFHLCALTRQPPMVGRCGVLLLDGAGVDDVVGFGVVDGDDVVVGAGAGAVVDVGVGLGRGAVDGCDDGCEGCTYAGVDLVVG